MENNNLFKMSELDRLYQAVSSYRVSENFMEMMRMVKRLCNLGPYNAFLVTQQRPGARFVASREEWNRVNRTILPYARPMVILVPFGPVGFVYDISDTVSSKRPNPGLFDNDEEVAIDQLASPFRTNGKSPDRELLKLEDALSWFGTQVVYSSNGSELAGRISLASENVPPVTIRIKENISVQRKADFLIELREGANVGESFASLCHEAAHMLCIHLRMPSSGYPTRHPVDSATKEFEAESTAWLVCERLGVHNPSDRYLSNYMNTNGEIPRDTSPERIFSAANTMLNACYSKLSYKSCWLYRFDKEFKTEVDNLAKCVAKMLEQS